ncbi:MAG: hypothetical protein V8T31_01620 [Lachnospiraceae bacterium]
MSHIYTIGEDIQEDATLAQDSAGNDIESKEVSMKVDQIQLADDLSLLDIKYIPDIWKNVTDESGRLKDNEASYVKRGDGVDTLDEVVRTENFPAKLVYATLTFTNRGEQDLKNIHYYIKMALLDQTETGYQRYDYEAQSGEDYDYIEWNGALSLDGGMQYYGSQNDNGKNYISSLAAGESTEVNVAWIVNEDDLGRMYLEVSGSGADLTEEDAEQAVLVDVRQ